MKIKKLISFGLCTCLSFAMAAPAFAADPTTDISVTYQEPNIKVDVPKTGDVAINPYALPYEIGKNESDEPITVKNMQIASAPLALVNRSDVRLGVKATATGVISGTDGKKLSIKSAAPANTVKTKDAYMYVEAAPSTITNDELADETTKTAKLADEFSKWTYNASPDADDIAVVAETGAKQSKNYIAKLSAAKIESGETTVQENGVALFRLSGKVVKKPTEPWNATDKVVVNVVFTFEPIAEDPPEEEQAP